MPSFLQSHLPSVGFQPRALLIPPTSSSSVTDAADARGLRRAHWQPALAGSSLAAGASQPAPAVPSASCVASARVANKDVWVVCDRMGGVAQWSIDGDCCYCTARLCPFPISSLRVVHDGGGGHGKSTFAVCASDCSPLVCIIDLLNMHVLRCIDVSPPWDAAPLYEECNEAMQPEQESESEPVAAPAAVSVELGVACMDVRAVVAHDNAMVPPHVCSDHLVVLTTTGRLSVWDLTEIIQATVHLSTDATRAMLTGSPDGGSSNSTKRARAASGAFFSSLPPLDCSDSACLGAPPQRAAWLASDLVSMRVYSVPMPAQAASAVAPTDPLLPAYCSAAFVLVVMRRHWIVLDADTCTPAIPLQHLSDTHPHDVGADAACSCMAVPPVPPPPPSVAASPTAATGVGNRTLFQQQSPLPLPPSPPSSRLSSASAPSNPSLPPTPSSLAAATPKKTRRKPVLPDRAACQLLGGSFVSSPAAASAPSAVSYLDARTPPPSVLLWTSCGRAWVCAISMPPPIAAQSRQPHPPSRAADDMAMPTVLRQNSAPVLHSPAAAQHLLGYAVDLAFAHTAAVLQLPAIVPPVGVSVAAAAATDSSHWRVHVPSSSGDLFQQSSSSSPRPLSILFGSSSGQLVEFELPLSCTAAATMPLQPLSLQPVCVNNFTDAFSTPPYLHRFLPVASPSGRGSKDKNNGTVSPPTLRPTAVPSCSVLLYDLEVAPDSGMSSLLVLQVQGYETGRMNFFKIMSSATPPTWNGEDEDAAGDSFHAMQGHESRVTALLCFQRHEGVFSLPLLVSSSMDGTVAVWEAHSASLVIRLRTPFPVLDLTRPALPPHPGVSPADAGTSCSDTVLVCAICADWSVRIMSLATLGWVATLRGHDSIPRAVFRDSWAAAADLVLVQTDRGSVYVWSVSRSTLEEVLEGGEDGGMEFVWRLPLFGGGSAAISSTHGDPVAAAAAAAAGGMHCRASTRLVSPSSSARAHSRSVSISASGPPLSPTLFGSPSRTGSPRPLRLSRSNSNFTGSSPHSSLGPLSLPPHARSKSMLHTSVGVGGVGGGAGGSMSHAPLSGISEGSPPSDQSQSPQRRSSALPPLSRSPSLVGAAPVHSTALLSASETDAHSDGLGQPRVIRTLSSSGGSFLAPPAPYQSSPAPSPPAPLGGEAGGVKSATWAVQYGLQRLWKLGGRGGLWGAADASSHHGSGAAVGAGGGDGHAGSGSGSGSGGGSGRHTPLAAQSELVCSFENVPSLHLGVVSVDVGYFAAEIRHQYAPLDSCTNVTPLDAGSPSSREQRGAPLLDWGTRRRAEVYKEVLKLLVDWNDEDDAPDGRPLAEEDGEDALSPRSARAAGAPGARIRSDTGGDVLRILRTQFNMRPPYSGRRGRASAALSGSLPPCYATYSPTNNALTILLPRTCSTHAQRALLRQMAPPAHLAPAASLRAPPPHSHAFLSRWALGANFTANHSLRVTTVLLALLGSSDIQLHNYYSLLENFYNATLPTLGQASAATAGAGGGASAGTSQSTAVQVAASAAGSVVSDCSWRYTEADLPFLASYALHEHEDIRRASRLLIQGLIGRIASLHELEALVRDWSASYDSMGRPPPLPWSDTVVAGQVAGATSVQHAYSFPAPPRLVSDFEFMTCMLLCYLQQAMARKRAALAASIHREAAHHSAAADQQQQQQHAQLTHVHSVDEWGVTARSGPSSTASASASANSSRRGSATGGQHSVISLSSTMIAGLENLTIQSTPPQHAQQADAAAPASAPTGPVLSLPLPPLLCLTPAPADKTPFIMSTLLRLLSQTHQDSSLHSVHKASICVELLVQGLSHSTSSRSVGTAAPSAAVGAALPDEGECNVFWQHIPVHALEPLYRILFDLSYAYAARDNAAVAAAAAAAAAGGDAASSAASSAPGLSRARSASDTLRLASAASAPASLAATCRVLLLELAKFDLTRFVEWARKEMFGYAGYFGPDGSAQAGGDFNGLDLPTAPGQLKKNAAAAAAIAHATAAASVAGSDPSLHSLVDGGGGCAAFKALQFDEYRVQLVGVLVSLPRKFANRITYGLLRSMIDLFIHVLDPLMVAQTRVHALAPGGAASTVAGAGTPGAGGSGGGGGGAGGGGAGGGAVGVGSPLRTRLQALVHPLFPFLASKYPWISHCAPTNKLSVAENPRWMRGERLARAATAVERRAIVDEGAAVAFAGHESPLIQIYDLQYASRWRTLEGHAPNSDVECIAFSPNGTDTAHSISPSARPSTSRAGMRVYCSVIDIQCACISFPNSLAHRSYPRLTARLSACPRPSVCVCCFPVRPSACVLLPARRS